jgi:NAD(P)H-hydrate epimerase
MKLVTSTQMQSIDDKAINVLKIPGIVLMENAANEVCSAIYSIDNCFNKKFAVITGPGNNGGDGFAISRKLLLKNIGVKTITLIEPEKLKGDSKTNYEILKNIGGEINYVNDVLILKDEIHDCDIIVDAIFGTGLKKRVEGIYKSAIELINDSEKYVVSVDIPSGLDSDSGKPKDVSVSADLTVTFAYEKIGHVISPGKGYCGKVVTADIGIPDFLSQEVGIKNFIVKEPDIRRLIRFLKRDDDAHKGDFGHVLVVAGSEGKTGAAAMSATAALRIGAGLVTMAVPKSLNPVFEEKLTEVMTAPVSDVDGFFSEEAYDKIMAMAGSMNAVIIGPGISTHQQTKKLVRRLVKDITDIPIVLDADGLNIIAEDISILKEARTELILTPHPGEMGRLTGKSSKDVLDDRINTARKFAVDNSVTLVLKGANTIVATKDGKVHVNSTGNAALSTAGTGDVLTGIIGGLLAQGLNTLRSCVIGTYIHGAVGDEISDKYGKAGIIATDLLGVIPSLIHKYST